MEEQPKCDKMKKLVVLYEVRELEDSQRTLGYQQRVNEALHEVKHTGISKSINRLRLMGS